MNLTLFALVFLVMLPPLLILCSSRAKGAEKVGWAILALFMSWVGYAAFLIIKSILSHQNESNTKNITRRSRGTHTCSGLRHYCCMYVPLSSVQCDFFRV